MIAHRKENEWNKLIMILIYCCLIIIFISLTPKAAENSVAKYDSMLSSPQPETRYFASLELAGGKSVDSLASIDILIRALDSEISNPIKSNIAIETYLPPSEFLKKNYCNAIIKLSDKNTDSIKIHFAASSGELRERLVFVLGFLHDDSVHKEIGQIYKSSQDPYIRLSAIEALSQYRDTLDVPIFEAALYDSLYVYEFIDENNKPVNGWFPIKNYATGTLNKMGYDVIWKDNKLEVIKQK